MPEQIFQVKQLRQKQGLLVSICAQAILALIFAIGFFSPYWLVNNGRYLVFWDRREAEHSGLWMGCLEKKCTFFKFEWLPAYFIVTQGLMIASIVCLALSICSHLIWICVSKLPAALITFKCTVGLITLSAICGACGVALFGYVILVDDLQNVQFIDWSYWLTMAVLPIMLLYAVVVHLLLKPTNHAKDYEEHKSTNKPVHIQLQSYKVTQSEEEPGAGDKISNQTEQIQLESSIVTNVDHVNETSASQAAEQISNERYFSPVRPKRRRQKLFLALGAHGLLTLIYTTGFFSPYWLVSNQIEAAHSGLWMACLEKKCIFVELRWHPVYFIVIQGLMIASIALLVLSICCHIVWTFGSTLQSALIAFGWTIALIIASAILGAAGIATFGYVIMMNNQENITVVGWSFWLLMAVMPTLMTYAVVIHTLLNPKFYAREYGEHKGIYNPDQIEIPSSRMRAIGEGNREEGIDQTFSEQIQNTNINMIDKDGDNKAEDLDISNPGQIQLECHENPKSNKETKVEDEDRNSNQIESESCYANAKEENEAKDKVSNKEEQAQLEVHNVAEETESGETSTSEQNGTASRTITSKGGRNGDNTDQSNPEVLQQDASKMMNMDEESGAENEGLNCNEQLQKHGNAGIPMCGTQDECPENYERVYPVSSEMPDPEGEETADDNDQNELEEIQLDTERRIKEKGDEEVEEEDQNDTEENNSIGRG